MALKTSFSSASSSSIRYEWSYDVFLSFRGTDTRHGFACNLYKALCNKGIHTFFDDEKLQTGEEISPTLVKAIEESRIAMIVFSENYAYSSFCLEELVKIMECVKGKDRLVIPIFYDVDPSHVRHQRGSYEAAMAKHEQRFEDDKEKMQRWKKALHQAANLSGRHFKHGVGYEHEFISKIVEDLSRKIKRVVLPIADYPVGLESQLLNIKSLLDVGYDDVRMVGIHGNGGIGKTTLALAVYNMIADHFEGLCFFENVRENSNKHGLVHLQNVLLSEVLGERKIKSRSVQQGVSLIQHRFQRRKVLLILDDVDKQEQLHALVGKPDWFGPGTRIIVTTRDKHLLACHGIERTYEVNGLSEKDALELLSWKAFKTDNVSPSYMDVFDRVVSYACGLPLALEVIGSNLFGKSIEEWEFALDQYEKIPHKDIQKILKLSFDALEEYQQNIFLDIACYYKGYEWTEFEAILHAHHDINPKYGIRVLVEKSLIKISEYGYVTLHDLIQDMGREIVRQESPKDPGKRSRLWLIEDIIQVLEEKRGSDKIESIVLDAHIPEKVAVEWDGGGFKKMRNLKTLIIRNALFSQGAKHLPNSLRVLEWCNYPSESLPFDFHPKNLFIFKMPHSNLISVQFLAKQKLMNLTVLNLDYSNIEEVPDLSGVPMLEELTFSRCYNLIKVHKSIGFLHKLRTLSGFSCRNLRSFPPLMLPSLEDLHLSFCPNLENFPEILGKMEFIKEIDFWGGVKELPSSVANLTKLRRLRLDGNTPNGKGFGMIQFQSSILRNLDELILSRSQGVWFPSPNGGEEEEGQGISIAASSNAKKVCFEWCNLSDESVPIVLAWFPNVVSLDLSRNNFTILPESIKELVSLRDFALDDCMKLQEIRGIPPNIKYLTASNCISLTFSSRNMLLDEDLHQGGDKFELFMLPGSSIPRWFKQRSIQGSISYWFRNKLPTMSLCVAIGPTNDMYPSCIVPELIINGYEQAPVLLYEINLFDRMPVADHIIIIDQKLIISDYDELGDDDELISENEWNHVVCRVTTHFPRSPTIKIIGIHLPKDKNNMEDIRFTEPFSYKKPAKTRRRKLRSLHFHPTMNYSLNDNVQDSDSDSYVLQSLLSSHVEQPLDDEYNNSDSVQSARATKGTNDLPKKCIGLLLCLTLIVVSLFWSTLWNWCFNHNGTLIGTNTKYDQAVLVPEPSHDDAEMEAFYASLDDADKYYYTPSHSHDHSATTATTEMANKALKIVQDFIIKDPSFLLDPEQCSTLKTSLDYLSNLSANDGILSGKMRTLISEASRIFTHYSKDYIEASMKIESTSSELLKVDELEADLEDNKSMFNEIVTLEKELLQKLVYLEESKKELEKQINAIEASISASESEQSMTHEKKRDIFEEGKTLNTQISDIKKKVLHLQHEQDLAKETQAKIKGQWSKLGEKFREIVVE